MDCLQEATLLYVLRLTIVLLLSTLPAEADELEESVQQVMEKSKEVAGGMEVPVNKYKNTGMKAAAESASVFNSPEFQEKVRCEQQRLKKEVFTDYPRRSEGKEVPTPGKLAENEKVYLFFSSSVPDETIHAYLAAMEEFKEPGITMLMKGFVPDERHRYLILIAKKDRTCVDKIQQENPEVCDRFEIPIKVQPSLFDKYEITQVPAIVYERDNEAWKITGDARLDYLLEKINQEAKSPGLKGMVTELQRGKHE